MFADVQCHRTTVWLIKSLLDVIKDVFVVRGNDDDDNDDDNDDDDNDNDDNDDNDDDNNNDDNDDDDNDNDDNDDDDNNNDDNDVERGGPFVLSRATKMSHEIVFECFMVIINSCPNID